MVFDALPQCYNINTEQRRETEQNVPPIGGPIGGPIGPIGPPIIGPPPRGPPYGPPRARKTRGPRAEIEHIPLT